MLLDFLANGMLPEEILEEYPHLKMDDIRAAIAYGAEMSRERYVEIPMATARSSNWNRSPTNYSPL